jgi:uncharacterized protein (TIGR00266 family)
MKFEVKYGPAYALGSIALDSGEEVQAVSGAMVSMSSGITIETGVRGGVMAGLRRSVFGGESFFINKFTAAEPGEVTMAPPLPGDVIAIDLTGEELFVHSGAFLAATSDVQIDTKWGGAKTFFSGEGLVLLKLSGNGTVLVSSFGAIEERNLAAGESHRVDTGFIVGFAATVGYNVEKSGGWKTTLLGGEGLVVNLTGPGQVYMQTRSPEDFVQWLIPQLPTQTTTTTND